MARRRAKLIENGSQHKVGLLFSCLASLPLLHRADHSEKDRITSPALHNDACEPLHGAVDIASHGIEAWGKFKH